MAKQRVSGLSLMSYPSGFVMRDFYSEGLSAPRPNPKLEDQVSVFMTPETKLPRYTPSQWVARDLGSAISRNHNNCEPLRVK